jgi:hypothetical protein
MIRSGRVRAAAAIACAALLLAVGQAPPIDLGAAREVSTGVRLYHVTDPTLLDPAAPISIWLLRLEPALVRLRSALANDEIMGTETVADMAERHGAVAAVNAGFFLQNGDPAGVLKIDGRLVSDARRPRGAVGILQGGSGVQLVFSRLRATASLVLHGADPARVPIDGIDTTRIRGRLMLFTPAYHADTDTAKGGMEWTVGGQPHRVLSGPRKDGRTPIPRNGFVLSYGGTTVPPSLAPLKKGQRVTIEVDYEAIEGPTDPWKRATHIVGGAGLLIRDDEEVADWSIEQFTSGFAENRHPRTLIGTAPDGAIWLITVDGRQTELSAGMTLAELRAFARRLALANALNLDGGGSTTMWVRGEVVNSPSDPAGPRLVSDALLVHAAGTAAGVRRP